MLKYLLLLIILLPSVSALNAFVDGNLLVIDGEGQEYDEEISIYYKGEPAELAGSVNLGCGKCSGINNFDLTEFDLALNKDYYFYVCDYEDKTNCERFEFDFGQITGEGCNKDSDCIPGLHCVGPGPNYGCCEIDEECYFNGECYDVGEFTSNGEYVCSEPNKFQTCNDYCTEQELKCEGGKCVLAKAAYKAVTYINAKDCTNAGMRWHYRVFDRVSIREGAPQNPTPDQAATQGICSENKYDCYYDANHVYPEYNNDSVIDINGHKYTCGHGSRATASGEKKDFDYTDPNGRKWPQASDGVLYDGDSGPARCAMAVEPEKCPQSKEADISKNNLKDCNINPNYYSSSRSGQARCCGDDDNEEWDGGECVKKEIPTKNEKDSSKYSDKEVFLISDRDWRDVLSLVPLTTWTGDEAWCQRGYGTPDNVCVYPTLIYHEEEKGFDADSIIYFMQQYGAKKVTVVGDIPQELDNLLQLAPDMGVGLDIETQTQGIYPENYLSYWNNQYKDVVYVEDDYESALLASTYASLINAPLIIKDTELDKNENLANRNIICIGDVDRNCNEDYNLEKLQKKYIEMTNTDKIILVNPNDLNIKVDEAFEPEKMGEPIYELYSKTSLAAPILAAGKHEIIMPIKMEKSPISIDCTNFESLIDNIDEIDNFINNKIDLLKNLEYLTIISSPNSIPQAFNSNCNPSDYFWYNIKKSVDNIYASSDNHFISNDLYDIAIESGDIYYVWSVKLNKRDTLMYQKHNIAKNTFTKAKNIVQDFQYLYDPKIDIDLDGNIHLTFRGQQIGDANFGMFYFKIDKDGNILQRTKFFDEGVPYVPYIMVDENRVVHITWTVPQTDPYRMEIYYAKISNGNVDFYKKIGETLNYLEDEAKVFIDNDNLINILWRKDSEKGENRYYAIRRVKLNNKGEIIKDDMLFETDTVDDFILNNFDITKDLNGNLIILASLQNFEEETLKYYYLLYSNDECKKIETPYANDVLDIFLEDSIINFIKRGEDVVNRNSFRTLYYGKIDLNGNLILDDEKILKNIDDKAYIVYDGKIKKINNKLYLVFKTGTMMGSDGEEELEEPRLPFFTIKENNEWKNPSKIRGASFEKDFGMKVGRIYGITLSDISSYIARSIFDNSLNYPKNSGISTVHSDEAQEKSTAEKTLLLIHEGYDWTCLTENPVSPCEAVISSSDIDLNYFKNKYIITFSDHGSPWGWAKVLSTYNLPFFSQSFLFGQACSTSDFERGKEDTFGMRVLRNGAIGYIGASGVVYSGYSAKGPFQVNTLIDDLINRKITIGDLYYDLSENFGVIKSDYLLYGDPTFEVELKK